MGTGRQIPTSRGLVGVVAALSIALWIATALFFFYINVQSSSCTEMGMDRCGLWAYFWQLIWLLVISAGVSAFAAISALGAALDAGDQVSAAAFGVLFVAVAFAVYALFQDGHPGHPLVTAIYGFPPDGLGLHAVAYYGSAALVVLMPLIVLAYALTRGRAQRVSAASGPLLVLGLWIAIRLAG